MTRAAGGALTNTTNISTGQLRSAGLLTHARNGNICSAKLADLGPAFAGPTNLFPPTLASTLPTMRVESDRRLPNGFVKRPQGIQAHMNLSGVLSGVARCQ